MNAVWLLIILTTGVTGVQPVIATLTASQQQCETAMREAYLAPFVHSAICVGPNGERVKK